MLVGISAKAAPIFAAEPGAVLLVKGLEGGSGSTVGPDGALYVPETIAGRIARVDPKTGAVTTFAIRHDTVHQRFIFGTQISQIFTDKTS